MATTVYHIKKGKSFAHLKNMVNHNSRAKPPAHADPNIKTHSFGLTQYGEIKSQIQKAAANQKLRPGAVLFTEAVLSLSPDYFRPGNPDEWGAYEKRKTKDWFSATAKYLKDEFGDRLISLWLHLDEATPHVHAIVLPLMPTPRPEFKLTAAAKACPKKRKALEIRYKNRLAAWEALPPNKRNKLNCKLFTSRERLHQFQVNYYEAVKKLGIEPPSWGSKTKHTDAREFYKSTNRHAEMEQVKKRNTPPNMQRI